MADTARLLYGNYSRGGLVEVFGLPNWDWETVEASNKATCPLGKGETETAGWGTSKACWRAHIHPGVGVCLWPGLEGLADDLAVREKAYQELVRLAGGGER